MDAGIGYLLGLLRSRIGLERDIAAADAEVKEIEDHPPTASQCGRQGKQGHSLQFVA